MVTTTPQEYDDLVKWLQSMAEYNPDYSPICEKSIAAITALRKTIEKERDITVREFHKYQSQITALRAERDAAVEALEASPIDKSSRSREYKQGYAAAWRAAVAWLHAQANAFRDPDPRARAIANSLAFQLGNHRKEKGSIGGFRRAASLASRKEEV